jgi:hypothetical protein
LIKKEKTKVMRKIMAIAALAVCMMAGNTMNAQTVHRGDRRMVSGMRSGQLTAQEMRQINSMKQQLQRQKMMARADGIVTFRERQAIDRSQARLDRFIFMQKNDRQTRRF